MTRITVLGGTGCVGSNIVVAAARRGHQVTSWSRNPPREPLDGITHRAGDLADPQVVDEALREADVVLTATIAGR